MYTNLKPQSPPAHTAQHHMQSAVRQWQCKPLGSAAGSAQPCSAQLSYNTAANLLDGKTQQAGANMYCCICTRAMHTGRRTVEVCGRTSLVVIMHTVQWYDTERAAPSKVARSRKHTATHLHSCCAGTHCCPRVHRTTKPSTPQPQTPRSLNSTGCIHPYTMVSWCVH